MRRQRHAKIVATLGPSSSDFATIRALFEAGADVFRLNFSHGSHDNHRERYDIIRRDWGAMWAVAVVAGYLVLAQRSHVLLEKRHGNLQRLNDVAGLGAAFL